MLLDIVTKNATDRSVILRIIDSALGTPETGVVYNSSGIDLWYRREGAAKVSITEASLSALTDAHADGGFLAVGDGYYRLDLPDAAVATGANYVDVGGSVTDMVVIGGRVRLVNFDLETALQAVNVTQFGGSNGTFSSGRPEVNTTHLAGNSSAVANLDRSARTIVRFTVGSSSTTTLIITSSMDPAAAVADQFVGRVVVFDRDTTSANLRGQGTDITASTDDGELTVTALTNAPVSGDTGVIL